MECQSLSALLVGKGLKQFFDGVCKRFSLSALFVGKGLKHRE